MAKPKPKEVREARLKGDRAALSRMGRKGGKSNKNRLALAERRRKAAFVRGAWRNYYQLGQSE